MGNELASEDRRDLAQAESMIERIRQEPDVDPITRSVWANHAASLLRRVEKRAQEETYMRSKA
jgi:hypothetical protein